MLMMELLENNGLAVGVLKEGLFFDGKYYLHGVKEVLSNDRYVLAIWYKSK